MKGVISFLKNNGLDILAGALSGNPLAVGVAVAKGLGCRVEDVEREVQKSENLEALKKLELTHKELLLSYALESKKVDVDNTKSARELYKSDNSVHKTLVKHLHIQFYFSVVIGVGTYLLTAFYVEDKGLAMAISSFISGIVTLVGSRVNTVDNFFFGSSEKELQKELKNG